MPDMLPTTPGALIGYRKDGRPIFLAAGGEGDGDQGGANPPAAFQPAQGGTNPPAGTNDPPKDGNGNDPPKDGNGPQGGAQGRGSGQGQGQQGERVEDLPDWAQKVLRDARSDAGKARTTAKQQAADEARTEVTKQIAKALGLDGDGKADPDQLAKQVEDAQHAALVSQIELHVHRTASAAGADPARLLDSRRFEEILTQHVDVTPDDPKFAEQVKAAITAAVDADPNLKAAPAAPQRSGTPMPGSPGGTPQRPTSLQAAVSKRLGGQ